MAADDGSSRTLVDDPTPPAEPAVHLPVVHQPYDNLLELAARIEARQPLRRELPDAPTRPTFRGPSGLPVPVSPMVRSAQRRIVRALLVAVVVVVVVVLGWVVVAGDDDPDRVDLAPSEPAASEGGPEPDPTPATTTASVPSSPAAGDLPEGSYECNDLRGPWISPFEEGSSAEIVDEQCSGGYARVTLRVPFEAPGDDPGALVIALRSTTQGWEVIAAGAELDCEVVHTSSDPRFPDDLCD